MTHPLQLSLGEVSLPMMVCGFNFEFLNFSSYKPINKAFSVYIVIHNVLRLQIRNYVHAIVLILPEKINLCIVCTVSDYGDLYEL